MDLLKIILQNTKDIKRIKKQLICCTGGSTGDCPSLSADADNILECRADGLYATASSGGGMEIGGPVTGGTPGSVLFIGAGGTLTEDNPNFFYDNTQNALAVGKNTLLDAKFSIHDVVSTNYLSLSAPDTEDPLDPGNPYSIQYYLRQVDGEWGEGFPTPGTGLRLDFTGTYAGTDPIPGLFQFGMPVWIDGDPANFVASTVIAGYIGAKINTTNTGLIITSQTGISIDANTAINLGTVTTGITAGFGGLSTLFSVSCNDGGSITATGGTGLTLEGYGGTSGIEVRTYVLGNPAVLGIKQSSTGSSLDPVATFQGLTNFVVQNNSGLYINIQPALPASQMADALRMTAKWTNIASPTSEIQFAARNANVDTQVLTIQGNANGRVGIGSTVTAPTARLHLPAGTATAQTAPLKFISGTLMVTPETGAVEFDGTHFYGTIGSTRFQLDQQSGSQNLQSVTTIGNTTTNDIIIGSRTNSVGSFSVEKTYTALNVHSYDDYSMLNPSSGGFGFGTFDASTTMTGNQTNDHFVAYQSRLTVAGTTNIDGAYGLTGLFIFNHHNGTGTITNAHGIYIREIDGGGPITNAYGIRIAPVVSGTNNFAIRVEGGKSSFVDPVMVGAHTTPIAQLDVRAITQDQALYVDNIKANGYAAVFNSSNPSGGNIGLDLVASGGTGNKGLNFGNAMGVNDWNIFSNGISKTYIAGKVGLGSGLTSPTAQLHLAAGAAAAGSAPLKLTSGTNLTTPEDGAFEYNGTNLFFTRTGAVRENIITSSAVTTESVVSDTTVTININGVTYKLLAIA